MAIQNAGFKADIKRATQRLSRLEKKQVPFATALALTRTAQIVQREETKQINKKIDRPTRFTLNAVGFTSAKKNRKPISAKVFIKDIQARYLKYQIFGGTRRAKGEGTGVPVNAKLNAYGNIPGRRKKAPLWRKGQTTTKKSFIATIRGVSGVWEHYGGKRNPRIRLLVAFEKVVKYRERFHFFRIAEKTSKSVFPKQFRIALKRALSTAK